MGPHKHRSLWITSVVFTVLVTAPRGAAAQTQPTTNRTLNLVNNCGETIWVGINAGTAGTGSLPGGLTLQPSSRGCSGFAEETPNVCPTGQTCNVQTGQCELVLDDVPDNFSGRLWPMTGCDFESATGLCPLSSVTNLSVNCCATGGCETDTAGTGTWGLDCVTSGQPPATVVEFTLSNTSADNYDVSLIDGFNVPVEIRPDPGAAPCTTGDDYCCGNPGGPTPITDLSGCTWTSILDETCDGNPALRVVDPVACGPNNSCGGSSTCNTGTLVCQCTQDSDCGPNQICGVGNNQIIGYLACGTFAGCTTPKDLCGIGQYFAHLPAGSACTPATAGQCASGICNLQGNSDQGTCAPSPADSFNCNQQFPGTISCQTQASCPLLTGIKFDSQAACACPSPTVCVEGTDDDWYCQEPCQCDSSGQNCQCAPQSCTSDSDCLTLANATATGTFMLCDATSQQCVSTTTSLLSGTGVNGSSCYGSVSTLCAGCPTNSANPLSSSWPAIDTACSNNPNWARVAQPWAAPFKLACPTAYSFPFDDPTSLFTCQSTGESNSLTYTITFCPAGSRPGGKGA